MNAESFPVAQMCVNTLPATKVTLITDGIQFGSLRVKGLKVDHHVIGYVTHRPDVAHVLQFYQGYIGLPEDGAPNRPKHVAAR
jgi:hypothetical protein